MKSMFDLEVQKLKFGPDCDTSSVSVSRAFFNVVRLTLIARIIIDVDS